MKNPDAIGEGGSPCGDLMEFYLKIGKNRIKDIKFETMGCAAAIATASVASELVKGKTISQAKKITDNQVTKKLGGLPRVKFHCCGLTVSALQNAIKNWEEKKKGK